MNRYSAQLLAPTVTQANILDWLTDGCRMASRHPSQVWITYVKNIPDPWFLLKIRRWKWNDAAHKRILSSRLLRPGYLACYSIGIHLHIIVDAIDEVRLAVRPARVINVEEYNSRTVKRAIHARCQCWFRICIKYTPLLPLVDDVYRNTRSGPWILQRFQRVLKKTYRIYWSKVASNAQPKLLINSSMYAFCKNYFKCARLQ